MLQLSNYIKTKNMRNLVNTIKKQDSVTLAGLSFVGLVILPFVGFIIYNMCIGNFQNF